MKPTRIVAALCVVLALQLSSCVTIVSMETVRPPAVRVSRDQWKVLVVNRYDAEQDNNRDKQVKEVLTEGAYQATGGAMGAIFNDSTFVLLNQDLAISLPSAKASQLSKEELRNLYTQYRPHLIMTLDRFDASLGKEVETNEDEYGFSSRTAHLKLVVASSWSLYDSTGLVLDRAITHQEQYYDSRALASGQLALGPAMAQASPDINILAVETGYSYWDRLYPHPIMLVRQLHMTKTLNEAVVMLHRGQFQLAINTLLPMAQDATAKHSGKAAYNLSVAYEAYGDLERAMYWARQAESRGDKLAASLLGHWNAAGMGK